MIDIEVLADGIEEAVRLERERSQVVIGALRRERDELSHRNADLKFRFDRQRDEFHRQIDELTTSRDEAWAKVAKLQTEVERLHAMLDGAFV